ncbi:MAG TPA: hypothetical protein VHV28_07430 [Solirubrobacteraceae bacterium]|jgi:hypothetical protein|nr:hypothetical protein [Solirubrobacteraceae bacterium]
MPATPPSDEDQTHRRVADALRTGGPQAPPELITAIRERVHQAYGPAPARPARPRRRPRGWQLTLAAPGLAAAVILVLVLAVGPSGTGPSIAAAARLALAPSTGAAPATRNARYLDVSYQGVSYPSYARFSVPATGTRHDTIGGRPALTVFYRLRDGARMSYTVFSGTPISVPLGAKHVVFRGVQLTSFSARPGLAVVTLVRFGRTCVLAGPTRRDVLLALAAAPVLAQRA